MRRLMAWMVLSGIAAPVMADTQVRFVLDDGRSFDALLYDTAAPNTVANFLNYVRDGDYDGTVLHRLVPDFVLQGGGFRYENDRFVAIELDPSIANEFASAGKSNVRGTLAMAKRGSDPNSAQSQWFINLVNNSALDSSVGGFTVFGEVIGDGMTLVDAVAALTPENIAGGAFASVPVRAQGATTADRLIVIDQVRIVPDTTDLALRLALRSDTPRAAEPVELSLFVENLGELEAPLSWQVEVSEVADWQFEIEQGQGTCTRQQNTLTCQAAQLAAGGFIELAMMLTPGREQTQLSLQASLSSEVADPETGNNQLSRDIALAPARAEPEAPDPGPIPTESTEAPAGPPPSPETQTPESATSGPAPTEEEQTEEEQTEEEQTEAETAAEQEVATQTEPSAQTESPGAESETTAAESSMAATDGDSDGDSDSDSDGGSGRWQSFWLAWLAAAVFWRRRSA